jgi:hypothetical protein
VRKAVFLQIQKDVGHGGAESGLISCVKVAVPRDAENQGNANGLESFSPGAGALMRGHSRALSELPAQSDEILPAAGATTKRLYFFSLGQC